MIFTPIDFTTWPRAEIFYYFSKMAPTGYSITVNMDVTALSLKIGGIPYKKKDGSFDLTGEDLVVDSGFTIC